MEKSVFIPDSGFILLEILMGMMIFSFSIMIVLPFLAEIRIRNHYIDSQLRGLDLADSAMAMMLAGKQPESALPVTITVRPDQIRCIRIAVDHACALEMFTDAP